MQPHGLQHARFPCSSLSSGACSNSRPLSQRCHPTISSSVGPFSRLQSFPASESFPVSQLFVSGGQSLEFLHCMYIKWYSSVKLDWNKAVYPKSEFLNFGTTDILGKVFLCCGNSPLCFVGYLPAFLTQKMSVAPSGCEKF